MEEYIIEMKEEIIEQFQKDFEEYGEELVSIQGESVRDNIFNFYLRETIIEIFQNDQLPKRVYKVYSEEIVHLQELIDYFSDDEQYRNAGRNDLKKLIKDYARKVEERYN